MLEIEKNVKGLQYCRFVLCLQLADDKPTCRICSFINSLSSRPVSDDPDYVYGYDFSTNLYIIIKDKLLLYDLRS